MLNIIFNIQISETYAFRKIQDLLNGMGHAAGLTYQSVPYDFSSSMLINNFNESFAANIKSLYNLTGKKVTIVAHSMGNLNVLLQLNKLDQNFKDKYISNWMAITPPFLGSLKA